MPAIQDYERQNYVLKGFGKNLWEVYEECGVEKKLGLKQIQSQSIKTELWEGIPVTSLLENNSYTTIA